jgi:hypothetical protein
MANGQSQMFANRSPLAIRHSPNRVGFSLALDPTYALPKAEGQWKS